MSEHLNGIGIETEERTGRVIVALPASAQDVAAVVRWAADRGKVAIPQWMDVEGLGIDPIRLSLERIGEVSEVVPADLLAVAGGGATVSTLDEAAGRHDLYWPPGEIASPDEMITDVLARTPGNWTLAGNLTRRYVLAVEAVLADGSVLKAGARTVKSVTGYDTKQLFVGSWATLGIITAATLRLEAVKNRANVSARYASDFEGLESSGSAGAVETGGEDSGLVILSRIKRELDPKGVFPPVEAVGRAT
jgi:glycolate oxidase